MPDAGQTPNTWLAMFTGGPLDGSTRGIVNAPALPPFLPHAEGRYRLLTASKLAHSDDLTGTTLLRGCRYGWEVPSRAETPPLPGGRQL